MAVVIDEPTDVLSGTAVMPAARASVSFHKATDTADALVELGIWLSGLESFLAGPPWAASDPSVQMRLIRPVLERCVRLNLRARSAGGMECDPDELGRVLHEAVQLSILLEQAGPLAGAELRGWSVVLLDRLRGVEAFHRVIAGAEASGEQYLPEPLKTFVVTPPSSEEDAELVLVLPRFAKILRWLKVVQRMLETDEPLKPAMVIFARVNEQMAEIVGHINNRLARSSNEDAELFSSLDAASYTATVALKKVFSPEFAALLSVRPAPWVYAGMETAYAVLNENFQQILAGLARIVDPSVDAASLFPASKVNFERSLVLRRELWSLVQLTQAAEGSPEGPHIAALKDALRNFMNGTVRYLFYKDNDTFERFVEEILVTRQTRDLVPILHRFGAYLETLFGHVNLRSVLEKHPFDPN